MGLQAQHERYLTETLSQGSPLFVTRYPKSIKPFYMLQSPTNAQDGQETVECFDLLFPEALEVAGGSMREHRLEPLLQSMQEKGMLAPGNVSAVHEEELVSLAKFSLPLSMSQEHLLALNTSHNIYKASFLSTPSNADCL
jgi:hypothetical protein